MPVAGRVPEEEDTADMHRPIGEMDLHRVQFLERSLSLLIKFTNSIGSFEASYCSLKDPSVRYQW